jgi:hypothetical protein
VQSSHDPSSARANTVSSIVQHVLLFGGFAYFVLLWPLRRPSMFNSKTKHLHSHSRCSFYM